MRLLGTVANRLDTSPNRASVSYRSPRHICARNDCLEAGCLLNAALAAGADQQLQGDDDSADAKIHPATAA